MHHLELEEREAVKEVALNIVSFVADCAVLMRSLGSGASGLHAMLLRHLPLLEHTHQSLQETDSGGCCARLVALLQGPQQHRVTLCGPLSGSGPSGFSTEGPLEPVFALAGPHSVLSRLQIPAADAARMALDPAEGLEPLAASLPYVADVLPLEGHLSNLVGTLQALPLPLPYP